MIYDDDGLVAPKNRAGSPEDDHEERIGCIMGAHIRPPQTVKILRRAICKAEEKNAEEYQVYSTPSDEIPMEDSFKLNLGTDQCPGIDPNEPVVLVKETAKSEPPDPTGPKKTSFGGSGDSGSQSVVYRTGMHVRRLRSRC